MLLTLIIGVSLASYLLLARNALNLSQRSFYSNAAMNLAESGAEQAFWALNNSTWTGWTLSGGNATQTFTGYTFPGNTTGSIKVCVKAYANSGTPGPIVAEGIIAPGNGVNTGGNISKWLFVSISPRSLFAVGMVGRNGITFSGNNTTVDSWNSQPSGSSGSTVAYSSSVADDKGSTATTILSADIGVGNGQINGYASVASSTLSNITVGSNGYIGPFGQSNGTINSAYVADNFVDNLPTVSAPTGMTNANILTTTISNGTGSLPGLLDVPASDGKYYYTVTDFSLTSTLTIKNNANVVITVNGTVKETGNGQITLANNTSTLVMYASGNVTLGGNGIANSSGQPRNFQLYGTSSTTSPPTATVKITGGSDFTGLVYAPNAAITIDGGGNVFGSVVGYSDNLSGGGAFHYDESLSSYGATGVYQPSQWSELASGSDRSTYASLLNF